jgi:hypothetical protein
MPVCRGESVVHLDVKQGNESEGGMSEGREGTETLGKLIMHCIVQFYQAVLCVPVRDEAPASPGRWGGKPIVRLLISLYALILCTLRTKSARERICLLRGIDMQLPAILARCTYMIDVRVQVEVSNRVWLWEGMG